MSNHVFLIATNYEYINLALNCCLSIKANDKNVKVGLVYCPTEVKELKPLIDKLFDAKLEVENTMSSPIEFAFYLKTDMYELATSLFPHAEAYLYLDSDLMMLPNRKVSDWFDEHKDKIFTAYCNDMYDYKTKTRKRNDYTFWCDPLAAKSFYEDAKGVKTIVSDKIPQINSSFVYFKKSKEAQYYFHYVSAYWGDIGIEHTKYRGVKPDEFCFNLASLFTGILPHRNTYRPIFFQFASELQSDMYMLHQYPAFGFAGTSQPAEWIINFYNRLCKYYRDCAGISLDYKYTVPQNQTPLIPLKPIRRKTLYRRGELPDSGGGIFNPSGIEHDGSLLMVYRKESDIVNRKYTGHSATAVFEGDYMFEVLAPKGIRYEDFRLFEWGGEIYCSHSAANNIYTTNISCCIAISKVWRNSLSLVDYVKLPIEIKMVEKNWVFFSQDKLYCIYSISPYRLFSSTDAKLWEEEKVNNPILNWSGGGLISNSTNPIQIDDSLLMFFHSKDKGVYSHGALLLDSKTREITHFTKIPFNLEFNNDGLARGILYVSGALYLKDKNVVRVFAGECDSNSIYYDFNKDELIKQIKKHKC